MSGKKVFISSDHTPSYFVYPPVGGYFDFCIQICHYNGGLSYKRTKSASGLHLPHPLTHEGSAAGLCAPSAGPVSNFFLSARVRIPAERFNFIGNSEKFPLQLKSTKPVYPGLGTFPF